VGDEGKPPLMEVSLYIALQIKVKERRLIFLKKASSPLFIIS